MGTMVVKGDFNETGYMPYLSTASSILNGTTPKPYVKPFDEGATIASGIVIFFFLVVGVLLNTLTIIVIRSSAKLRNVFMCFIISLCVSDLMSALISPLFWYRRTLGFDVWVPPNFFCKLYWAVDLMTTFSTSMHILNFAVLRYISIEHPSTFQRVSKRGGRIWILIIWVIAFLCGFVPLWIFTGADSGVPRDRNTGAINAKWPACTMLLPTLEQYRKFAKCSYSIFILLPMLAVGIVSTLIFRAVHEHSKASIVTNDAAKKDRLRKERQAVLQLVLIVVSFLFGYTPFVTYEIWSTFFTHPIEDYWFGLTQYFFLRFSECMNPIFYNVSSAKMRRHTMQYLKDLCKCCVCNYSPRPSPISDTSENMGGARVRA